MAGGNPISADAGERRGARASRLAARLRHALGAEALVGPFHQPLGHFSGTGPTEDELARLAEAHRAMADRARAAAGDRAAEPVRMLRPEHRRPGGGARRGGGPAELRLSLRHLPLQHRGARPGGGDRRDDRGDPGYIHISENDRGTPGRGHIDHAAAIRAARGGRLRRLVHVEAFGQALPDLAPRPGGLAAALRQRGRCWRPARG